MYLNAVFLLSVLDIGWTLPPGDARPGTPVRMVCGVAALQSAPGIVCERRASVVVRRPATTSVREPHGDLTSNIILCV